MIKNETLYKRYDRKLKKGAKNRIRQDPGFYPDISDYKDIPEGWIACEPEPDKNTGHWPGWLQVDFEKPENKWHKEGFDKLEIKENGTYELIGPKIQGNPYNLTCHLLIKHNNPCKDFNQSFESIRKYLSKIKEEGLVFHHEDGRMRKIRRKDFGFEWPLQAKTMLWPL